MLCHTVLCPGASEHDLMSRIIETLGPPPEWMMAAAKRTDNFFKRVPVNSDPAAATAGPSSAGAEPGATGADAAAPAAASSSQQAFQYVLFSKEEFEAVNKCQVCRQGGCVTV